MLQGSILTFAICISLAFAATSANNDDRIDYVFELVRHGARAPDLKYGSGFEVGQNQLTASGMRQRFLLGSYYRQRYIEEYGVLSEEYDPEEIFMVSTDVNRTIQSGQSELMGLYPPGATLEQISAQVNMNLAKNGVGMPPFRVRDADVINKDLGLNALPHGIVGIPIVNDIVPKFIDDVEMDSCDSAAKVDHDRFPDSNTYVRFNYLIPLLRDPMKVNFNMTDEEAANLDYLTLYGQADAVQSQMYEGIAQTYPFTEEDLHNVNMTQVGTLVEPLTDAARSLWISKMLRSPFKKMDAHVQQVLGTSSNDVVEDALKAKFEIFSAHDYTVSAMVLFLNATNGNFTTMPFASQINIELHHSESCLTSDDRGEHCFSVETRYNGILYEFPTCDLDAAGQRTQCSVPQFKEYIDSIYIQTTTHFADECATAIEAKNNAFIGGSSQHREPSLYI